MTVIREPKEKDLMHFTRYVIEFFRVMYENNPTDEPLSERLLQRKYWAADQFLKKDENHKLFVADRDGRMIGYIIGELEDSEPEKKVGRLKEVFVDEFYRREGVGTALCKEITSWMETQQVKHLQFSIPTGHASAEFFLQDVGFQLVTNPYK